MPAFAGRLVPVLAVQVEIFLVSGGIRAPIVKPSPGTMAEQVVKGLADMLSGL